MHMASHPQAAKGTLGGGGWVNLLKKRKFVTKIFLSVNAEWRYKILWNILSAEKLEIQCKKVMYSSFDFGCYSILSVKNRGWGFLLKHDKSYLPVVPKTAAWAQHLFLHYLLFTYFYLFSLNIISNQLCQHAIKVTSLRSINNWLLDFLAEFLC